MSREIDRRDRTVSRSTAARKARLDKLASEVSDELPGNHRIKVVGVDRATGNPVVVSSTNPPSEKGDYVRRALNHVSSIKRALGIAPQQPAEFVADPAYLRTSSGGVAVNLQQHYKGIPIFDAAQVVRFNPKDTLQESWGSTVTVERDLSPIPQLSVEEATLKAAQHVAVPGPDEYNHVDQFGERFEPKRLDLANFTPTVKQAFYERPERETVLERGPFAEDIRAKLIWLPMGDELRLCWEINLALPDYEAYYRTLVDARTGEILYCLNLVQSAARANVFGVDGDSPREMTDIPVPLATHDLPIPSDLPQGFPDGWVAGDRTEGNNVTVRIGLFGEPPKGTPQGGDLVFDPVDPQSDEQKAVNLFYFVNRMHDFHYLLGFREKDGNFQQDKFGRGGTGGDPVSARIHSGAVPGTANFLTLPEGISPLMNLGLVSATSRHTALDSTVVFHEFTHGVTNRLVGGPKNVHALNDPQSGGMGEGWGDYFACTINETTVVGSWLLNKPGGMRAFPYDSNYPANFGDLGKGRYTEVHNIGEIWCATLMEMNRKIGKNLAVQLVIDALKLSPVNPSFLDMRDAILIALNDKLEAGQLTAEGHALARKGIWEVFGKFGMGANARSDGATLTGIVADFSTAPGTTPEKRPRPRPSTGSSPSLPLPLMLLHHAFFGHIASSRNG